MAFTEKQQAYIDARANGLPKRKAVIHAGYSPSSAAVQGSILESRDDIKNAIKAARKAMGSDAPVEVAPGKSKYLKEHYDSPLDLYLDVMNNPLAPDSVRIEAAKQALPYTAAKPMPKGKKDSVKDNATEAAKQKRLAPPPRPQRRTTHHAAIN